MRRCVATALRLPNNVTATSVAWPSVSGASKPKPLTASSAVRPRQEGNVRQTGVSSQRRARPGFSSSSPDGSVAVSHPLRLYAPSVGRSLTRLSIKSSMVIPNVASPLVGDEKRGYAAHKGRRYRLNRQPLAVAVRNPSRLGPISAVWRFSVSLLLVRDSSLAPATSLHAFVP